MRSEGLHEVVRAAPFRPFAIVFADGKQLVVRHPEWILHPSPTQRTTVNRLAFVV